MKNGKTEHFWRIHRKVASRMLSDMSEFERHVIASDREHVTPIYRWFEEQSMLDAERLYADKDYYLNLAYTFRYNSY